MRMASALWLARTFSWASQLARRLGAAAKHRALMLARKKPARPDGSPAVRLAAAVRKDHVGGQVLGFASQAIRQPASQRRKTVELEAAVQSKQGRRVVGTVGL